MRQNEKKLSDHSNILVVAGGQKDNQSAAHNQRKVLDILSSVGYKICLITHCDDSSNFPIQDSCIKHLKSYNNPISSFILEQISEIKAIYEMNCKKNVQNILFTMGRDLHILPILFSKILGKKVFLRSSGRSTRIITKYLDNKNFLKIWIFKMIEKINYCLVNSIFTECEYAIKDNNFEKYGKTYSLNLYTDTHRFISTKKLFERTYDIGYIGRFHEEKGIINIIKSVKDIVKHYPNIKIFIAGEGYLLDELNSLIKRDNIQNNVYMHQWISHSELPEFLNQIKIILNPSIKEGLPNMILEAMACKTAVLATSVGAIPAIIKDGETGFIMDNNSPECIAHNVIRVLQSPNLDQITKSGRQLVENNYSFEKTLKTWKMVFQEVE